MKKIIMICILTFTILFCNSYVLAETKTVITKALIVSESAENTQELIKTGIRITFWLFPVIIGIAIIKNINVGKDKK